MYLASDVKNSQLTLDAGPPVLEGAAARIENVRALCHDMRQPLTALRLMAQDHEIGRRDAVLTAMLDEVNWLATLVESVLGCPAEAGPRDVALGEVTTHAAALAFGGARCSWAVDVQSEVIVWARRSAVERALRCVLDNAMRAAGDHGHVDLAVSSRHGHGVVEVSDDGPGLGGLTPQHSLGLPTVRAVLADCGGSFSLRNGVGGGAVATIEIPLATMEIPLGAPARAS
jgi:K+-sensing histidine kinase KdpD